MSGFHHYLVYETQHAINANIANYADALYFTVTALTTTGFGDIVLQGTGGRMIAARVTKRPDLGPDYALILPIALAAAGCIILKPTAEHERLLLLTLNGYAILKTIAEFFAHVRRLSHHIRPGELLSFAVRSTRV